MTETLKELKEEIRKVDRSSTSLVKLMSQFEKLSAKPVDNAYMMEVVLKKILKTGTDYQVVGIAQKLKSWGERSTAEVSTLKDKFKHDFGLRLQELLKSRGFELGGRYPNLNVKFYTIHIDFPKGFASLIYGHEPVKDKIPLSPEDVTKAIGHVDNSLNRPFDASKFINILYESYLRVCRIRGASLGEKVPIIEVLQQFILLVQPPQFRADPTKEHYQGYGRAHFGHDLYRLRLSGIRTSENQVIGLMTATFDATRKRENFIWVPDNERGDGTTYSLVFFKKADSI